MIARLLPLLCLGLVISCEKSPDTGGNDEVPDGPRITKTDRRSAAEPSASRKELRATVKAASEIAVPEERERALATAIWDAFELDPKFAREAFHELTSGSEERNRLLQHFALRLTEEDPESAAAWASSLPDDEEKSLAFGRIAIAVAEEDPARAAQILSDSGVAGREFDVAVVQVVQSWAAESPADAIAWVGTFENGELRDAALKETLTVWMRRDAAAAVQWIESRPDPAMRQQAVNGVAETILNHPEFLHGELLREATPEMRTRFEELKAEAEAEEAEEAE